MSNVASTSDRFLKRVENELSEYGMTLKDLEGWEYCGGTKDQHLTYFRMRFGNIPLPEHVNKCLCRHPIVENCYITDGKEILVLGNCCIKRFVPKCTRTCEICGDPHKNRTINRCNICRDKGFCKKCKKKIDLKYTLCYTCKYPNKCRDCGRPSYKNEIYCTECGPTHWPEWPEIKALWPFEFKNTLNSL